MTTTTLERPPAVDSLIILAAWSMIAGALLQMILGIPLAPFQDASSPAFRTITTLNAVSHLLLIAGVAGLVRSGAAGQSILAVAGLALTLVGLAVLVVAEATSLVAMSAAVTLFGIATLALAVGLILAGVAALRARRRDGWRRFTPLACGLFIPLVLLPSFALPGLASNYAIGLWGVCWLLLGLALRAEATPASDWPRMSVPVPGASTRRPSAQPSLRTITVAALVVNALLFLFDVFSNGPDSINLTHVVLSLVVAGIVATRFRWVPAAGALLSGLLVVEGSFFLGHMLTEPDSAATFAFGAIFFAVTVVGLVAGIGATVQAYRGPSSRPFTDRPTPRWTYPALLAVGALVLGGILATALQQPGAATGFSPDAVAALPALTARDFSFDQREIRARVGETVVLRLDNTDSTAHYLDIDEFNVHALMPPKGSNVALFRPTQPGTYTFYCRPHADKVAGTGMVGTLVVAP